jgi:hypothetical protein
VGGSSSFVGGSSSFVGGTPAQSPGGFNPIPGQGQFSPTTPTQNPGYTPSSVPPPGQFNNPGVNQPVQSAQNNAPGAANNSGQFNSAANTSSAPGTPAQTNPAAAAMLNNILTNARPVGTQAASPGQTGAGGQQMGLSIAGVASTSEEEGIMVYNDHTHYNEWEFIFDQTKQKAQPNIAGLNGANGTPAQNLGSTPGGTPGTPVAGLPGAGATGASPTGIGGASPFGGPLQAASSSVGGTPGAISPGAGQTSGTGAPGQAGQAAGPFGQSKFPPGVRPGVP